MWEDLLKKINEEDGIKEESPFEARFRQGMEPKIDEIMEGFRAKITAHNREVKWARRYRKIQNFRRWL